MRTLTIGAALLAAVSASAKELPKPLVTGLTNPESVAVWNGNIYVTVIGDFDKDGDGGVYKIENGKAVPFAVNMDDPKGLAVYQQWLYVADKTRVLRIDAQGKVDVVAGPDAFPTKPLFLNDITADPESGTLYVSDSGDLKGKGGAVYRIDAKTKKVTLVKGTDQLNTPNGVQLDGASHLLVADFGTGELFRFKLADGSSEKLADGLGGADGITWDHFGRLFLSDWKNGKLYGIYRPGMKPVLVAEGFGSAADTCLDATGQNILVPDMKNGTITAIPTQIPGYEVDQSPLPLATEIAFPNLEWTDWKSEDASGKIVPLRPIVLTHFGDGSNRVVVATQHGVIHTFANDPKATKTDIFLDIQDRVSYRDDQNEEGFLGLAFHPKFKENGEFFIFYTPKKAKGTNIVSRFRTRKDDPSKGDPDSEEILLSFTKPFWNHDGGTIVFGPDGYLYITHGDGGMANDPFENGQKRSTLLGKILRIDVDNKNQGLAYAIPKDNPFVGQEGTRPEIWALGFRNIWRMAFDPKSGDLWAADVGQNLWEEINIVRKGGNYGWNIREGQHPFGAKGVGVRENLVEPIWEYHHEIGKSVTGGGVYRGSKIPELDGKYVYADYVSGRIWALTYDGKRVTANQPIKDRTLPILSFGQDEKGELYLLTYSPTGKGLYQFVK